MLHRKLKFKYCIFTQRQAKNYNTNIPITAHVKVSMLIFLMFIFLVFLHSVLIYFVYIFFILMLERPPKHA
jgi:hypothetical protein